MKIYIIILCIIIFVVIGTYLYNEGFDVPAIDCVMGEWIELSPVCSKTCGGGTKNMIRKIITPASGKGKACGKLLDLVPCNTHAC